MFGWSTARATTTTRVEHEERDHEPRHRSLEPVVQLALRLDQQVDPALHREHRDGRRADEHGEWRQQPDQPGRDVALGVERQAVDDVAEGQAQEECEARRGDREDGVPGRSPASAGLLGPELEGDRPEDHHQQDQDEGQVQAREQRRIRQREDREQDACAEHQPDLVAVPDRADAVEKDRAARCRSAPWAAAGCRRPCRTRRGPGSRR